MQIRPLTIEDELIFKEMLHKFYHSPATMTEITPEQMDVVYKKSLEDSPYFKTFLIEDLLEGEIQPVGYFILAFTWYTEFAGLIAVIDEIYLDERTRGKGIGSQVFAHLKEMFVKNPEVKAIRLEYSRSNQRAVKLYQSLGYEDWDYGQMFLFLDQ